MPNDSDSYLYVEAGLGKIKCILVLNRSSLISILNKNAFPYDIKNFIHQINSILKSVEGNMIQTLHYPNKFSYCYWVIVLVNTVILIIPSKSGELMSIRRIKKMTPIYEEGNEESSAK